MLRVLGTLEGYHFMHKLCCLKESLKISNCEVFARNSFLTGINMLCLDRLEEVGSLRPEGGNVVSET